MYEFLEPETPIFYIILDEESFNLMIFSSVSPWGWKLKSHIVHIRVRKFFGLKPSPDPNGANKF